MLNLSRRTEETKRSYSLEGEGAAIQLLRSAEARLLGWGAAEQQELMGGVHELQLLSRWHYEGERGRQWEKKRAKRPSDYTPQQTMNAVKNTGGDVIVVSYPTERQLDDMGPVTGNNPAERPKGVMNRMSQEPSIQLYYCFFDLQLTSVDGQLFRAFTSNKAINLQSRLKCIFRTDPEGSPL